MSKKFTKAVLSAAMAGVLFGVSFDIMAADEQSYSALNAQNSAGSIYKVYYNPGNKTAHIDWGGLGDVVTERNKPIPLLSKIDGNGNVTITSADGSTTFTVYDKEVHDFMKAAASNTVGSSNGAPLTEQNIRDLYNRVSAIQQMKTNVGLDENGNVAADSSEIKEYMPLQHYLAWEAANSTIVANELEAQKGKLDAQKGELEAQKQNLGKLTTRTDKIDAAAAATAAKVESRTLVGVSSDGTLTRAEGAKNTISVNDGLVALSGRTDRIDAAVGAIDG
ncbi:hypothetical protein H0P29_25925, partial [Escherichia coli]|uniref:hypothetical protein n=1 Tax=Escherichia coli TaxID=562 RepID=UPI0015D94629